MVEHLLAKERVESSNLFIRFSFWLVFRLFNTAPVRVVGELFNGEHLASSQGCSSPWGSECGLAKLSEMLSLHL